MNVLIPGFVKVRASKMPFVQVRVMDTSWNKRIKEMTGLLHTPWQLMADIAINQSTNIFSLF
jgi:hypothetical protein